MPSHDALSQTFSALADPTRRAMLARLAAGEANVSELAEPFLDRMSLPAVTKHVKVLERAGLVTKGRDAQWRPCKLNTEPFKDVDAWMEQSRALWEEQLDRLDEYLKTVTAARSASTRAANDKNTKRARGKTDGRKTK